MKIPNIERYGISLNVSLARIVSEDSQHDLRLLGLRVKSSKDS